MIRVNDDYIIDIDSLNYTVKRDRHKKVVKKDPVTLKEYEEDTYSVVGYYSGLTSAIKGVIADMNIRELTDGVHTLKEAIDIVVKNNRQVSELLQKALEI